MKIGIGKNQPQGGNEMSNLLHSQCKSTPKDWEWNPPAAPAVLRNLKTTINTCKAKLQV
jgi:hypothetical protein